MKAMEAPEKIYLTQLMLFATPTIRSSGNEVEYVRTDAFIEKAQDFFRQSHHLFGLDGNELYHFIEDFVKYMKGE